MTDEEIRKAMLSGISKAKVPKLVKDGQDYIQAGRAVIKANFSRIRRKPGGSERSDIQKKTQVQTKPKGKAEIRT